MKKENIFDLLSKKFYKDLFVLTLYSIIYLYLNSNNYDVKTNVNDQGHEYDILYDHSSIEISFRRSSKDIENLSKYIERKRKYVKKCSFIFIVDNDDLFEECLEIIENFRDVSFIVILIEKDMNIRKSSLITDFKEIKDLYTYILLSFLNIENVFDTEYLLISPLTSKELTKQYRIMFVFAYFILVKYIDFRLATRIKNISEFVKHLVKDVNIHSKKCLKKEWIKLIEKCESTFKIRLSTQIDNLVKEKEIFEKTIQDLPSNPLKEDIENLLTKYRKKVKC